MERVNGPSVHVPIADSLRTRALRTQKQIIRDVISPSQNLGHSDSKATSGTGHEPNTGTASVTSSHG